MAFSSVLEVAIGLVLIYYVLGLVVSYITTEITRHRELRAQDLVREFERLLGTADNRTTFNRFMNHPLIESLAPRRVLLSGAIKTLQVDDIPPQRATLALLDILFPGKSEKDKFDLSEIRAVIAGLPEGEIKQALERATETNLTSILEIQFALDQMVNDTLAKAASLYTQHSRRIVIVLALVVTLITGVDSVAVTKRLWLNPTIRARIVAAADQVVQDEAQSSVTPTDLQRLDIPVFWNDGVPLDLLSWFWKIVGLVITWVAVAQGSSFWYDILNKIRTGSATEAQPEPPTPLSPRLIRTESAVMVPVKVDDESEEIQPPAPPETVVVEPEPAQSPAVDNLTDRLDELALTALRRLKPKQYAADINVKMAEAHLRIDAARQDLDATQDQIKTALQKAIARFDR